VREHLSLLEDNRQLSARLAGLTGSLQSIDSRLERIERMLSRMDTNLMTVSGNPPTSDT